MKYPIIFNSSESCYILPRLPNFPNGSYFDYNTCPERYDNTTQKLVRYCCFNIIINVLEKSNYKKIQDWLTYNSSSLLVLPAIFFNLLSLLVLSRFSRLSASATSTNFYMQCLCVFDTLTILSKLIHEVVVVRNTIRDVPIVFNSILCKFTHFTESVFAITSIYILIVMSFDKLICVALPLKVGSLLRPKRARLICTFIILFATLYSCHHIVNQKVHIVFSADIASMASSASSISKSNKSKRDSQNSTTFGKRVVYECIDNWRNLAEQMKLVDNIIRVFVPILLLCICNLSIAIVLAKARKDTMVMLSECTTDTQSGYSLYSKKHGRLEQSRKRSSIPRKSFIKVNNKTTEELLLKIANNPGLSLNSSQNNVSVNDETSSFESNNDSIKCSGRFMNIFNRCRKQQQKNINAESNIHNRRAKQNSHYISVMLFSVCFGFVVLNLPFAIKTLLERKFREKNETLNYLYSNGNYYSTKVSKSDIINAVKYDFFVYITHFLLDLNYIANFFLYFLSGSRFRSRLYALIRCKGTCNRKNLYSMDYTNNFNQSKMKQRATITVTTNLPPSVISKRN
jgi:hypothetical protein